MLTQETKNQLKPLIKKIDRDPLLPRQVNIYCVGIVSGERAANIIAAATGRPISNVSGFGPSPLLKKMFAVRFDTVQEADEFASDLTTTIAEAVDEGLFGRGTHNNGRSFFQSTLFYALCAIAVVIVLAVAGFAMVQKKKI